LSTAVQICACGRRAASGRTSEKVDELGKDEFVLADGVGPLPEAQLLTRYGAAVNSSAENGCSAAWLAL
jgi:hypothetical protein